MDNEKERWFEKQFFEEHGRYPNDDEVMEWGISVIDQYREDDAFKSINKLISEEYADCVSEAVLLGNRWDDGDKYIIVKTTLSDSEERFTEMSEKIMKLFGMRSTHVLTYDYYDAERYYLEIYDDFDDGKKIYPEIYNSPLSKFFCMRTSCALWKTSSERPCSGKFLKAWLNQAFHGCF